MSKILIVDDEVNLVRNLSSYLSSFEDEFSVLTAQSAEGALEILAEHGDVDILLTDVRLPGMDGIELVRRSGDIRPDIKLLVMTAFSSGEIRKSAAAAGALRFLEKPLDLKQLRATLLKAAEAPNGWSGSVGGLDLFDFTQLFTMSGKTAVLEVRFGAREGKLGFLAGDLIHASAGDLSGDEAFYSMTTWNGGVFEELPGERVEDLARNMKSTPSHLLMEAARLRDEAAHEARNTKKKQSQGTARRSSSMPGSSTDRKQEVLEMAVKDLLAQFEDVQGFRGIAVFTPQGEMVESIAKGKTDIKTVGMYANNALLNAQKATDQMGVGRGNLMQIRAPEAIVMMRCLNEATDFAATKEGKAHFHTVVILDPDGNTGMAAMILDKAVSGIADELR